MGRISELYSGILKGVDLSPTDQLVGFMLLASLQRMRRRHYIIRALVAAAPGEPHSHQCIAKDFRHAPIAEHIFWFS